MVALCNALDYRSRPPAYIVADQADQGRYLASESTSYRVLLTTANATTGAREGAGGQRPAHQPYGTRPQSGVELGYLLAAGPGARHLVVSVSSTSSAARSSGTRSTSPRPGNWPVNSSRRPAGGNIWPGNVSR